MDEHIDSAITVALRHDGFDVVTAHEDGSDGLEGNMLLTRATLLARVLVTHDQDFLVEAAMRQRRGVEFAGIIYGRHQRLAIGKWIDVLKTVAYCSEPEELKNQVCFVTPR